VPERAQFARLRRIAKQVIDTVDDLERDGVDNLGAALKVVGLIERSLVKRGELGLERFDSHPLFSNACKEPHAKGSAINAGPKVQVRRTFEPSRVADHCTGIGIFQRPEGASHLDATTLTWPCHHCPCGDYRRTANLCHISFSMRPGSRTQQ
jgi:hypothetical protein